MKEIELGKRERKEKADTEEGGKVTGIASNVHDEEEEDWDSLMFSDTHMTASSSGVPFSDTSTKVENSLVQGDSSVPSPLLSPPTSLNSSPGEDTDHRSSSPYRSLSDRQHPSPFSSKIKEKSREPRRREKLFSSPEEGIDRVEKREDKREERRELTFRKAQNLLKCSRRRREAPPFLLVHGVFGAGKSSMLAATLASLCRLLDEADSRSHVLLVCNTNTALDAVLLKIRYECQYTGFARIGRLSETHPNLLPYAVSSTRDRSMAVEDWRRVLLPLVVGNSHGTVSTAGKLSHYTLPSGLHKRAEIATPSCRDNKKAQGGTSGDQKISTEGEEEAVESLEQMAARLLGEIERGTFPPTMVQWKSHRLLATTCSTAASSDVFSPPGPSFQSSSFPAFSACPAPFVFVDEATQVTESLALAVLTRFAAVRCLQVGDSKQLPPVVKNASQWGSRSLFRRLLPSHLNRMALEDKVKGHHETEESDRSSGSSSRCSSSNASLVAHSDDDPSERKTRRAPLFSKADSGWSKNRRTREEKALAEKTFNEKAPLTSERTSDKVNRLTVGQKDSFDTHSSQQTLSGVRPTAPYSLQSGCTEAVTRNLDNDRHCQKSRHFHSLILLRTQYRCHPAISALCSRLFYGENYLKDGVTAEERLPPVPAWGGPLSCVILRASSESRHGRSFVNREEANIIAQLLFDALREKGVGDNSASTCKAVVGVPPARPPHGNPLYRSGATPSLGAQRKGRDLCASEIGVICLYKSQVTCVQQALADRLPREIASAIQVSTVDAFQGAEKDLIFLSCVRSRPPPFLSSRPGLLYPSGFTQSHRPGDYGKNIPSLPRPKGQNPPTANVDKACGGGSREMPEREPVHKSVAEALRSKAEENLPLLVLSDDEDEEDFAAHQKTTGDFMNCPKRMNVALSRARRQLVVVGHEAIFRSHPAWHELWKRSSKLYT
ncbi:aaa domain protein [Cystoisospora suis]|uniref:Aaa domain protein n=1 Tax=Cystoisospora suis TaxID=483139 RepID=A0A2C6L4U1_9APIC|nr:aaa domain protein [Cystoisospora suis]